MRGFGLGVTAMLVAAAALGVTSRAPQPGELPRYVLTDREAFVLGAARLVAPPPVTLAEWSSDGEYVLAAQQEKPPPLPIEGWPTGKLSLILWNRRTGHAAEIWTRPAAPQRVEPLGWLPKTHVALMVVASPMPAGSKLASRRTLFWVDLPHRRVLPLRALTGEEVQISPSQPFAVLLDASHERLRVIRADRSMGRALRLWGEIPGISRWSPEGSAFYWVRFGRSKAPAPAPPLQWLATNPQTGATTVLSLDPPGPPEPKSFQEKPLPVHLQSSVRYLPETGSTPPVSPLFLERAQESDQPRLLVCADSDGGSLAPDASAVLYLSQGTAWVAPLERLPRTQMLARVHTIRRSLSMFRAGEIAHALSLYVQDYDGAYPPAGDTVLDAIRPYTGRDDPIYPPGADLSGIVYRFPGGPAKTPGPPSSPAPPGSFVYRFAGGSVPALNSPRTTELGYVPGPGGRAVIYADGHVEWRASPPARAAR